MNQALLRTSQLLTLAGSLLALSSIAVAAEAPATTVKPSLANFTAGFKYGNTTYTLVPGLGVPETGIVVLAPEVRCVGRDSKTDALVNYRFWPSYTGNNGANSQVFNKAPQLDFVRGNYPTDVRESYDGSYSFDDNNLLRIEGGADFFVDAGTVSVQLSGLSNEDFVSPEVLPLNSSYFDRFAPNRQIQGHIAVTLDNRFQKGSFSAEVQCVLVRARQVIDGYIS
ncbi:MAG TPA: hypothetical protein VE954_07145 [Oligoflexus sp.]|uniref:hypothetical protein n=1 Tax=Oligoflexus sp. TaxID=1971216 RepID=UPI002D502242|nr:hypothetical protein [Oligoflexus sp.]HYX32873.1 hypothetical protein [Oligoflexus sp.]